MKESFSEKTASGDFQPLEEAEAVERLIAEEQQLIQRRVAFVEKLDVKANLEKIYRIPQEDLGKGFQDMIARLDRETDVIEEVNDTIGRDNILSHLAEGSYAAGVLFGQEEVLNSNRNAQSITGGDYDIKNGTVRIAEQAPSMERSWLYLTMGIPRVWENLDHELTHHWFYERANTVPAASANHFVNFLKEKFWSGIVSVAVKAGGYADRFTKQYSSFKAFADRCDTMVSGLVDRYVNASYESLRQRRKKNITSEVSAQKAGRALTEEENNTIALLELLMEGYGYREPAQIDMIIVASQIIDRLRVLGYNDRDIAIKLAEAHYDKAAAAFVQLEREIEREAEQKGMDVIDLDTKADILRLEKRVDISKTTVIAQEELQKLLG